MHAVNVVKSLLRERTKGRSPHWRSVRRAFLVQNPQCAACGGTRFLQVHHVQPYHLRPEIELDPRNLITLCMGPGEHHLKIGHGDDFDAYNPDVVTDVLSIRLGKETDEVVAARAKAARLFVLRDADLT